MSVIPDLIWNPEVPFLFELIWIPAGVYPHRGTGMIRHIIPPPHTAFPRLFFQNDFAPKNAACLVPG